MKAMTSLPLPGYTVKMTSNVDGISEYQSAFKLWHSQQKKTYFFQADNNEIARK